MSVSAGVKDKYALEGLQLASKYQFRSFSVCLKCVVVLVELWL